MGAYRCNCAQPRVRLSAAPTARGRRPCDRTGVRLLHVITGLATGGAERALYALLAGGLAARHRCTVVSLGDAGVYGMRIEALGVRVNALGMRSGGAPMPAVLWRLRRIVRGLRPELVQGWMYHGNLAAWLAWGVASEQPVLVWNIRQSLYGLRKEKRFTRVVIRTNRRLSGAPAALIYNSALSRAQHEHFGFHAASGHVIPNGFDVGCWRPASADERARIRKALGIPTDVPVIGHVARLHPMKDHPRFLRTAVRLAERYPELHVLLAGTGVTPDQPLWCGLVPPELAKRFHFLGERNDVSSLLRAIDVLCVSSAWGEAFPNVLGEAMASGVPCVATDVGDSAAILGDTGLVVRPRDDGALYDGLCQMLDVGAEARQACGRAARARVQAQYGLDAVVAQYSDLYGTLMAGG